MTDLRDIVNAATPGPWIHRQPPDDGTIHEVKQHRRASLSHPLLLRMADTGYTPESSWDQRAADARFIATFDPTLVSALLDVVDAADQVLRAHDRALDPGADMDWTGPAVDAVLRDALDRLAALEDTP